MTAKIIDGKAIAQEVRAEWKVRADALKARGITPDWRSSSSVKIRSKVYVATR